MANKICYLGRPNGRFRAIDRSELRLGDIISFPMFTAYVRGFSYDSEETYVELRTIGTNDITMVTLDEILVKREDDTMANALSGYKKVAMIRMGCTDYFYALYDDDVKPGDTVLVSGGASNVVQKVADVLTADEAKEVCKKNIISEVICKIDTSAYDKRVADRKEAEKLKKEMDKVIKQMEETEKYELYAARYPEIFDMLVEYKKLVK